MSYLAMELPVDVFRRKTLGAKGQLNIVHTEKNNGRKRANPRQPNALGSPSLSTNVIWRHRILNSYEQA
jgi:hypothetical protein